MQTIDEKFYNFQEFIYEKVSLSDYTKVINYIEEHFLPSDDEFQKFVTEYNKPRNKESKKIFKSIFKINDKAYKGGAGRRRERRESHAREVISEVLNQDGVQQDNLVIQSTRIPKLLKIAFIFMLIMLRTIWSSDDNKPTEALKFQYVVDSSYTGPELFDQNTIHKITHLPADININNMTLVHFQHLCDRVPFVAQKTDLVSRIIRFGRKSAPIDKLITWDQKATISSFVFTENDKIFNNIDRYNKLAEAQLDLFKWSDTLNLNTKTYRRFLSLSQKRLPDFDEIHKRIMSNSKGTWNKLPDDNIKKFLKCVNDNKITTKSSNKDKQKCVDDSFLVGFDVFHTNLERMLKFFITPFMKSNQINVHTELANNLFLRSSEYIYSGMLNENERTLLRASSFRMSTDVMSSMYKVISKSIRIPSIPIPSSVQYPIVSLLNAFGETYDMIFSLKANPIIFEKILFKANSDLESLNLVFKGNLQPNKIAIDIGQDIIAELRNGWDTQKGWDSGIISSKIEKEYYPLMTSYWNQKIVVDFWTLLYKFNNNSYKSLSDPMMIEDIASFSTSYMVANSFLLLNN
jgi:hypothetical protein